MSVPGLDVPDVSEGVVEDGADVVGAVEDLGMGEAQAAQAGSGMDLIAAEIHRLLGGGPVMAQAVGLDDEAEGGPEEIDSISAQPALRLGRRNAGLADDREEAPLERVRRSAEGLRVEDPLQPTYAGAARLMVERRA